MSIVFPLSQSSGYPSESICNLANQSTMSFILQRAQNESEVHTHTLQAVAPQCDLCRPPAAASGATPYGWTVLATFLHKHLQHAHMVTRQLVAESQTQITLTPGRRRQGKNQLSSTATTLT